MDIQELRPNEFERARSLFHGFDYSLSIRAAIEGRNPGWIFVDNVERPCTAFALTVEGYLLAGDHDNSTTNEALRRLLKEQIFTGQVFVNGNESMSLAVHPQAWEARLPELIPTHEIEKLERYHYLCRAVKFDWRNNLPEGYTLHRVDPALMGDSQVVWPDPLRNFFLPTDFWGTMENFWAQGVSFCIVHEQQVVSWCTCDCATRDQIDVGIVTHPSYRRRGLAAIAVAATVEHCLSHGFSMVGWHCNAQNVGSWKTAEKVGFERNREYIYYYYMYDPIDHLAELGWYYYRRGEYARTVQYYEQAFARRDENPDYYYHLTASAYALLGNKEKALEYLHAAAAHGWADVEWTKEQEEFGFLQGAPEWEAALSHMERNAAQDDAGD
jgi:GNAT superfamily N-acetyltransferase